MKIKSSYSDFYDWISYSYPDSSIYYPREETQLPVDREFIKRNHGRMHLFYNNGDHIYPAMRVMEIPAKEYDMLVERAVLLVGERVLFFFTGYNLDTNEYIYFPSRQDVINWVEAKDLRRVVWIPERMNYFPEHMKVRFKEDVRTLTDAPVVIYGEQRRALLLNPNLSQRGLQSLISDTEVYSEIELYLNKQQHPDTPIKIQDDIVKRNSAGFDDKSFKHRK